MAQASGANGDLPTLQGWLLGTPAGRWTLAGMVAAAFSLGWLVVATGARGGVEPGEVLLASMLWGLPSVIAWLVLFVVSSFWLGLRAPGVTAAAATGGYLALGVLVSLVGTTIPAGTGEPGVRAVVALAWPGALLIAIGCGGGPWICPFE